VSRVARIWRREGFKVPGKQPKRRRLWLADGSCIRLRPERASHVWTYDFVPDRTCEEVPHAQRCRRVDARVFGDQVGAQAELDGCSRDAGRRTHSAICRSFRGRAPAVDNQLTAQAADDAAFRWGRD
jgi:hypothetical protein